MGASILCLSRQSFISGDHGTVSKSIVPIIEKLGILQKEHDRIWNGRQMNDSIIMNQSQSIGISARGRALGFGHALSPWALGPGLGPGRRFPGRYFLAVA